jgi:hypothetical protein
MARSKVGPVFLQTINKPATSLSPDDMKNYAKDRVNEIGLNALTKARGGTGQRAAMPKARRQLFTQNYWKAARPHPDYTLGDLYGVTTRKQETTGSQTGGM